MENVFFSEAYSPSESDFTRTSYIPALSDQPIPEGETLAEKLQATLELTELLEIYARYAAGQINFSGLSFYRSGFRHSVTFSEQSKFAHHFSLNIGRTRLGHLCYNSIAPIPPLQLEQLQRLHRQLLFPLRNCCNYQELKHKALHDHLTGLGNRGLFDETLSRLIRQAERSNVSFSLMLLDLDRFKQLNDEWGHDSGDQALCHLAKHVKASIRGADSAYRLGGDEFAILLFNSNQQSVEQVSNRLQRALNEDELLHRYDVSTSIGATPWQQEDSPKKMFRRADKALYRAKASGRNCLKTA